MARSWREIAESGYGLRWMFLGTWPIVLAIFIPFGSVFLLMFNPTMGGIFKVSSFLIFAVTVALPFPYIVHLFPALAKFDKLLAQRIKETPTPYDEQDAEDCLLTLQRWRWMHRLSCKLQGLDYNALLNGCRDAQKNAIRKKEDWSKPCDRLYG